MRSSDDFQQQGKNNWDLSLFFFRLCFQPVFSKYIKLEKGEKVAHRTKKEPKAKQRREGVDANNTDGPSPGHDWPGGATSHTTGLASRCTQFGVR
jgi:hypothetical protein